MSATTTTSDHDSQSLAVIDRSLRHPVMLFLTAGAAWLAVAILLGVIASAKVHNPGFLSRHGALTYGRVFPAHINALVYGWGMQAGFALILWLGARLSRKEYKATGTVLTAGLVWNLGVALGITGILSGNGTGMPWMEFPGFVWPVLIASYLAIVIWPFIQFRVRPKGPVVISQWYILAAMIWFPWIYVTANVLLHCLPGHPVMAAGINAWYKSALVFLFFTPVALGTAYDLVANATGRQVPGAALANLGFWSLAIIAPWAGMQKLAGMPVPYFLPYLGAAATVLLFIPICAAACNILRPLWAGRAALAADPSVRFTAAGMIILVVLGVAMMVLNIPDSTLRLTQFSLSGYGFDTLALYGFFSLVMFAAAYSIVPRVTGRAWHSSKLIEMHFLFSVYGLLTVMLVTLVGGVVQGMSQEDWKLPWPAVAAIANPFAVANTFAWCLILFANLFFLVHLAVMWLRWGGGGSPATAADETGTHDAEGDTDDAAASPDRLADPTWQKFPMSLRTFIFALAASFGVAWLSIIVLPFFKMRALAPIPLSLAADGASGIFFPKRTGRVADGARVYAENGCYLCHTQVVRPTYAGHDLYRPDWGGLKDDADRGDTRRETNAYDFFGEKFAQIGVTRTGPDLSNIGRRVETIYAPGGDPAAWLLSLIHI